jgi:Metal-dependent amidase/aminoacylase/carboxypeptidase
MPHTTIDPIIIGTKIIDANQSIVSRYIDPQEPSVLSVTHFHAGDTYNVIPNDIEIKGCTKCFSPKVQKQLEEQMHQITKSICEAYGASYEFEFEHRYPATINSEKQAEIAGKVAQQVFGEDRVNLSPTPGMGSEDFAYMLQEKPGSYIWIENGDG